MLRKLFSSLAVFAFTTLPVVAISCQRKVSADEVIFKIRQFPDRDIKVFETIVKKYNAQNPNKKVKLVYAKSRENIFQNIALQLEANDETIPNLVLYYPSLANLIAKYDRSLDFYEETKEANLYPKVLLSNKQLGIPKTNNSIYNLPIGLSNDILIINNLYLGFYLFKLEAAIKKNNLQINIFENKEKHQIFDNAINVYLNQQEEIKQKMESMWNEKYEINIDYVKTNKFIFKDSIFKYNDELLN
ncbi:hypothetical protein, partial [Metamycoplasma neophronis]